MGELETRARVFCDSFPPQEGRYPLIFFDRDTVETKDLREGASTAYLRLKASLQKLYHSIQRQGNRPPEADALIRRLEQLLTCLEEVFDHHDPNSVYWLERRGRGVFLNLRPIDVSGILQRTCLPEPTPPS